jgi:hypothetical protein
MSMSLMMMGTGVNSASEMENGLVNSKGVFTEEVENPPPATRCTPGGSWTHGATHEGVHNPDKDADHQLFRDSGFWMGGQVAMRGEACNKSDAGIQWRIPMDKVQLMSKMAVESWMEKLLLRIVID